MFECIFHYYDRSEDGKYNTEEKKTFTKTVGKRNENTELSQCAKVILGQLARRDVWVVDVEISEYSKKPVSFKETKGGIIVKNRKYTLDSGEVSFEEFPSEEDAPEQAKEMVAVQQKVVSTTRNYPTADKPPLRYEIFRPNREDLLILQRKGTKLTLGRKYPIFEEKIKGGTELFYYVTQDDSGVKLELNSLFFEPERRGLIGVPNSMSFDNNNLQYMGGSTDMPTLRG